MSKTTRKIHYDFRGHQLIAATASGTGGPFVKADTSSAGSPTVVGLSGGGIRMAFDSQAEVQNLCVYMGDILSFDIDEIIRAEFVVKAPQTFNATSSVAFGLASARNDAIDSITEAALFRCIGNNSVVVETDDGTNNNDDVSTGLTLGTSWQRFKIDFASRNTSQDPPSLSLGRKSNIEFYGPNAYGSLRRVASGTRFDMSNYSSGLQLFFQLQKTSDANTDAFDILEACVEVNVAA